MFFKCKILTEKQNINKTKFKHSQAFYILLIFGTTIDIMASTLIANVVNHNYKVLNEDISI